MLLRDGARAHGLTEPYIRLLDGRRPCGVGVPNGDAGELSRDTVFYSEPDNRGTDLASAFSVASVCTCEIVAKRQLTIGPTLRHEE